MFRASRQPTSTTIAWGAPWKWLYAHDVTRLFAGIALRARQAFGIEASHVHVDTTSFSMSGQYEAQAGGGDDDNASEVEMDEEEAMVLAVTYGYSREHRADLKQWMLALATTHEGDVPMFMPPLDANGSDGPYAGCGRGSAKRAIAR